MDRCDPAFSNVKDVDRECAMDLVVGSAEVVGDRRGAVRSGGYDLPTAGSAGSEKMCIEPAGIR